MNTFKELAEKRYSCRRMTDKEIPQELIDQIIETAIVSPTAVNKQPYKMFLMNSDEAKEKIKKTTSYIFGANTFIVVGAKKEEAWVREFDGRNFADVDASIVATHIMMSITDLGLETTWVGHFDAPLLQELCPEMQGLDLIAIFPIGYPREDARPAGIHFKRKAKEDVLEVL